MRVLVVEDEPYMAEAIRDGLRLEAIAADIAGDGDTALEMLSINGCAPDGKNRHLTGPAAGPVSREDGPPVPPARHRARGRERWIGHLA